MLVTVDVYSSLSRKALAYFTATYGEQSSHRLTEWQDTIDGAAHLSEKARALEANAHFNQYEWKSDLEHWGKRDYWATPFEMIGTNAGDCEDYCIGKYFMLAELSVAREKLLMTYVRAPRLRETHMVLAYYPSRNADPYILDNLTSEVRRGSERLDLIPVYSFNADGLWKAVQRRRGRRVGGANQLKMWRRVVDKMKAEGYDTGS